MNGHVKILFLFNQMLNIFPYDLSINAIRAYSLRVNCIIETVKRRITIWTVSFTVREKSNKDIILNSGRDKQASSAEPKGC